MSFVIMVSNGGLYSDFMAWPVATVLTKDNAKKSVRDFNAWRDDVLLKFGDEYSPNYLDCEKFGYDESQFFKLVPCPPFGKGKFEVNINGNFGNYGCYFIEVDDIIPN